jgi:hypothetical protein
LRSVIRRVIGRNRRPFDEEELEAKLIWIYGSPRTGSTWLLEMLCDPLAPDRSNPLGFSWPESWSSPAFGLPMDEFLISAHLVPSQGGTVEIGNALYPATLNSLWARRRPSYAFSEEFADVWRPEVRRLTLARLQAVVERARKAGLGLPRDTPHLVIKEVNGSHAADLVMSLFPRSRMIFLVRDGRDVIDSLLAANSPGGWRAARGLAGGGFDSPEERLEWVREGCRSWTARMNVCDRAYEAHDPALRRRLRYEDLLADTPAVLAELLEWIGLPSGEDRVRAVSERHAFDAVPDSRKGPGKVRRSATPGGWREGLTPEEQAMAHEIMGDRLTELGYASGPARA